MLVSLSVDCGNDSDILNYFRVYYENKSYPTFLLSTGIGTYEIGEDDMLTYDSSVSDCCSSEVKCFHVDIMEMLTEEKVDMKHLPKFLSVFFERSIMNEGKLTKSFRVVGFSSTFSIRNVCEYALISASLHQVSKMNGLT